MNYWDEQYPFLTDAEKLEQTALEAWRKEWYIFPTKKQIDERKQREEKRKQNEIDRYNRLLKAEQTIRTDQKKNWQKVSESQKSLRKKILRFIQNTYSILDSLNEKESRILLVSMLISWILWIGWGALYFDPPSKEGTSKLQTTKDKNLPTSENQAWVSSEKKSKIHPVIDNNSTRNIKNGEDTPSIVKKDTQTNVESITNTYCKKENKCVVVKDVKNLGQYIEVWNTQSKK